MAPSGLRVVVVGAGPAGTSAAAFIRKMCGVRADITVVEPSTATTATGLLAAPWRAPAANAALGLWGPALRALGDLDESVLGHVVAHGEWVGESGYTSHTDGSWLLKPSSALPDTVAKRQGTPLDSLLFLEAGHVRDALTTYCTNRGVKFEAGRCRCATTTHVVPMNRRAEQSRGCWLATPA